MSRLSASETPQPLLFQLCYWSPRPERENVRVSKWIQESLDLWDPQALLREGYFLSSVGRVLPHLISVLVRYMRTNHLNFPVRAHPRPSCVAAPRRHTWHLVQRGHSGNRRLLQTCMRAVLSLSGNSLERIQRAGHPDNIQERSKRRRTLFSPYRCENQKEEEHSPRQRWPESPPARRCCASDP